MNETITAIATPPGQGGVGIVRISGPASLTIANKILGFTPKPRYAHYTPFYSPQGEVLDEGIALFFPNPHSFTGEDVLELHGHGGPVILDIILKMTVALGARLAKPGEFSEQAFLNDKLDLTQVEAIADLINAESEQAARSAVRSLQGEFSKKIHSIVAKLIKLRMYVEAAIDFPEEEIDFLKESTVIHDGENLVEALENLLKTASQGVLLRDGVTAVIAGPPNAGKSSLLNTLSGKESAIVTEIAGTTRDVLREHIQIDGMPVHIVDTAGLRETDDVVEQEGVRRARAALENADLVLCVLDSTKVIEIGSELKNILQGVPRQLPIIVLMNKIDLTDKSEMLEDFPEYTLLYVSIKSGKGIDLLKEKLKSVVGYQTVTESNFIARRRHIDSLENATKLIRQGVDQLKEYNAGELFAEDLRLAQDTLNSITGEFSSDDLLGEIFSSFCIGK